jgi:phosphoribosyl 1,2-cyclic phosphodiesterase
VKVKFWGVHGSIPVPGPQTLKYGGNTSCVELNSKGKTIIFDSGTGIRALGLDILNREGVKGNRNNKLSIFFSHVHWDHIQGFPFFKPIFLPEFEIDLYGPVHSNVDIESALRGQMVAPRFPIHLKDLSAKINFKGIRSGENVQIDDLVIENVLLHHPHGAFGYKITCGNKSVAYICDHEYSDESKDRLVKFLKNANQLIYDSHFTPEEYSGSDGNGGRKGWGHSTWIHGVELCKEAKVNQLVLTHHGSEDKIVEEMESQAKKVFRNTVAAYEGLEINLS